MANDQIEKDSRGNNSVVLPRRELLRSIAIGTAGIAANSLVAPGAADAETKTHAVPKNERRCKEVSPAWRSGFDGQRRADLGNGRFLNPVVSGDRPDPTILKDGEDYYMTFSSFDYYPAVVIWHSRDLVNWTPVGPALRKWIGSVWAMDLIKHQGRYYVYIPTVNVKISPEGKVMLAPGESPFSIHVIHAENIHGPWSDPIDLKINGFIDPGHVVGEDGKRYLFVNDGHRVRLTDDGLATDGKVEKVYSGWKYPSDWVVEAFALEGPKIVRKDGWFYIIAAEGGTAGPPTSHMVIAARSRSIHGPWENCPHNPIVHTQSAVEPWWSRGHATPVQSPKGDWWLVYHGYENGYRTLGRQTLLEPMEWTEDGWPRAKGGNLSGSLPVPAKPEPKFAAGQPLSDDFSVDTLGTRLAFFSPRDGYLDRISYGPTGLVVQGSGTGPADSSPLAFIAGDHSYEIRVEVEVEGDAQAGLLEFYSPRAFCGLGFDGKRGYSYGGMTAFGVGSEAGIGQTFHLKLENNNNVVSFYHSTDGESWNLASSAEMSGYNHNVAGGFLSLRPALYVSGKGKATFRKLKYAGTNGAPAGKARA
ncbi:MAG: family 43 glycosylhydrolase [Acidobacteria bacterium]|nr:family 43 glycosylhydrolase [Acidobacteriota bacterium]